MVETCSGPLHVEIFIFEKLKFQFLVVFQSFGFRQKLANFGNFGQIWAKFVALTVVESMPEARLKSLKPFNS
jgi:hypothetical protein